MAFGHRWALASKKLTPGSASFISVRYRTKKYRIAPLYFGTGRVPISLDYFSPVPDYLDAGQSGIPAVRFFNFEKLKQKMFPKIFTTNPPGPGIRKIPVHRFIQFFTFPLL
jgi:hypothetical protein